MDKPVTAITAKPDKGYTLIEILVSILIMLIIILGLMQTMAVYISHNIKIALRNEAVKIAQSCLEDLRNGQNCPATLKRKVRNFNITFNIAAPDVGNLTSGVNQINVTVSYSYKGQNYTHTITSVIQK